MTIHIVALTIIVVLVSNFSIAAQTPSRDQEKGFVPGVPYAVSDTGNINLTNGNLSYSFPLGALPQGRGSATAGLFLLYNSKLWKKHVEYIREQSGGTTRQTFLGDDPEGGWNYGSKYELLVTSRNDGLDEPLQYCRQAGGPANIDAIYTTKVQIAFPDGSKREFWPTGFTIPSTVHGRYFNVHPNGQIKTPSGGCSYTITQSQAPYLTYYSVDGSYMNLKVYPNLEWELSMADGSRVTNTSSEGHRVYDRNGNYVSYGGITLPDGSTAIGWVDQFGRYVATRTNTAPDEDSIYQLGFGGQMLRTKIRWKTVTVIKKYRTECTDCTLTRGQTSYQVAYMTFRVVASIQNPNGLTSTFDYHAHDGEVEFNPSGGTTNQNWSPGWGEVKSLTLPSAAKTDYNYKIYTEQILSELQITPTLVLDRSGRATEKTLSYQDEYSGVTTPRQDKWLYTTGKTTGGFVGPDGRATSEAFYHLDENEDLGGQVYRTWNTDGTITEKYWQFNNPAGFNPGKPVNPYVKAEFKTVSDASGNPALTAIKNFTYDKNGNVTQIDEYDWVPYNSIPRDQSGRVSGLPTGALPLLRVTRSSFYNPTPTAADAGTVSLNAFWNAQAPRLRGLVAATEVVDASGAPQARTELKYDYTSYEAGNTVGGNTTETRTWDSFKNGMPRPYSDPLTTANSIVTSATYNAYGLPSTTTDARGIVTRITYGTIAGPGTIADLYPTQIVTASGTNVSRTTSNSYDFYTGLAVTETDVDNNVAAVTDYDMFGRPVRIRTAVGTPRETWTRTEYDDLLRRIVVRSDIENMGDGRRVSIKHFDQLGRERLARTLEDISTEDPYNEGHGIKVETRYGYNDPTPNDPGDPANSLGDFIVVSNPFRASRSVDAAGEESMGWTRTYSLRNGNRTEAQSFTGAALPAPWGSNSNSTGVVLTERDGHATTMTDQAGKRTRNIANALGQLVRVDEPNNAGDLGTISVPAQPTLYSYDVLGSLVRVTQGQQSRDFMYDSLGRLVRVRQPEQIPNAALSTTGNPSNNTWTTGFTYDDNGNLLSARDARNVIVTSVYDARNRPTNRSYSDSTPAVTYVYDDPAVAFSKGRLTKISSTVSEMRYLIYDENGRLKTSEQVTDGRSYVSRYAYDLAGTLTEQTYPSGRVLKNFLDTDGDIGSISSKVSNGPFKNYAASFSYTASRTIKRLQLGNGLWESSVRNSRDQVTELNLGNSPTDGSLLKLSYHYGELDPNGNVDAARNSGNIAKQMIRVPGVQDPFVQVYRYDSLDRISQATETVGSSQTWTQAFGYDRYGNRTSFAQNVGGQQLPLNNITLPQVDPNTNRFQTGQGYAYDPAGNLISDPQGRRFTFNGENKQTEVRNAQDQVIGEYRYDGNGKRVKKITASETTVFVYDGLGKLVAELSTAAATPNPTVNYTATDSLGSPRVLTNSRGQVVSRRDFMPFGEELAPDPVYRTASLKYGVGDNVRKKFTGYERDDETGLDFAEARYYSDAHGRFTAVDPLIASGRSADPQTFNRYVYVMNRPLFFIDPHGHRPCRDEGSGCDSSPDTPVEASDIPPAPSIQIAYDPSEGESEESITKNTAALQEIANKLIASNWSVIYGAANAQAGRSRSPGSEVTQSVNTQTGSISGGIQSGHPQVTGTLGASDATTAEFARSLEQTISANTQVVNNSAVAIAAADAVPVNNSVAFVAEINRTLIGHASTLVARADAASPPIAGGLPIRRADPLNTPVAQPSQMQNRPDSFHPKWTIRSAQLSRSIYQE